MRISAWSADLCSSDLVPPARTDHGGAGRRSAGADAGACIGAGWHADAAIRADVPGHPVDRGGHAVRAVPVAPLTVAPALLHAGLGLPGPVAGDDPAGGEIGRAHV